MSPEISRHALTGAEEAAESPMTGSSDAFASAQDGSHTTIERRIASSFRE
jgi:hypothetical protein